VTRQVHDRNIEHILQGGELPDPIGVIPAGTVDEDERLPVGAKATVVHPAGQFAPADFPELDHGGSSLIFGIG
jgi:hypothetical protein